jgi:formylglycine-generating enzyme required for sulfatase activity
MVELSHAPEDLLTNPDYKETLMVFRQVPAGTFLMGSDDGELGRGLFETRHQVTLTQDYWIGVFEVTQAQYQYVMGMNPSTYLGAHRPVETVSWDAVRGGAWPGGAPGEGTFMDRLGILCGNALAFDLPTEAQWEYACRAETTTALNNGKNLTDTSECPNMAEVGRYFHNTPIDEPGHAAVGFYTPNSWGIYDMHGNVGEFCLDWVSDTDYNGDEVDPAGPAAVGYPHRNRGGSFGDIAMNCRSACRGYPGPVEMGAALGFRAVFAPR